MRLREIVRFELDYQLRRVSTWLYAAILFVFAFALVRNGLIGGARGGEQYVNAPIVIAAVTVFGGVIWLLTAAAVAGEAAARDVQTRMHPLTYTAPVHKAAYLGGRFLAAFVLNALILLAVPAGILLAAHVPGAAGPIAPFRPAAYLTAYGFIALPNAFVITAIQFSWATLNRRAMAAYLTGVLLLVGSHFGVLAAVEGFGYGWDVVRRLDLVGIYGIGTLGATWTPTEKNTRLVGLDGLLLANRLIWLAVALVMLAVTYLRFRFAHVAEGTRRSRAARRRAASLGADAGAAIARSAPVSVPPVRRTFGAATHARQTLAIAGESFRAIARSRAGLSLVGLYALHLVLFMHEYMRFFGVPLSPRTDRVLAFVTAAVGDVRRPLVVIPLLIAYFAGELVWRERDARASEMADAMPVPDWALFLGKLLGLGLVIAAWLALLAGAGMLGQLAMGHRDLQPGLYLAVLFGLQLPEYLLFACLALAIHTVVDHKYLGHLAALLALGLIGFAPTLGVRHNLLVYGAGPAWSHTEMRGFGASLGPWLWFKLYWAAWAILLAVAARLLWSRGREGGLGTRLRTARQRLTRPTAGIAAVAAALVLGLGAFIFHNTHVRNEYRTEAEKSEDAAEYERRYRRYAGVPQPTPSATKLRVEIHPRRRAVEIHGTHLLVNRGAAPIDTLHVATVPAARTRGVAFDRPAARVLADDDLGHHVYALETPLQPGEAVTLRFEVRYAARGFGNGGIDESVVANGTLFQNHDWLPTIGYQPGRELRGAGERRAHGLAARPSLPGSLYDVKARRYMAGAELVDVETIVGTDAGQTAIAPGTLRRAWTERGRRYFHYATDAPVRNEYSVFSARYAVRRARWNGVAIEIFHHPDHTANLDRMVRGIQASLTHYTAAFGPYPYRHVRFVERAGGDGGMSADASTVTYEEGFSDFHPGDPARGLDLPFYVVAHEVAHQWWGAQLSPAFVEGGWLMSESLAVYSGMQVLEEAYGSEQLRRYLAFSRARYQVPRSRAAVPLLRADEAFLGYRKGAVAMYAMIRYVGRDRVNGALRRLVERHAVAAPPLPTTLDLHRELRAATPDSLRYLLRDLFEANTYWELETERARATETGPGAWRVTLEVRARKVVVDTAGVETEVPMDDLVEIGVSAPPAKGGGPAERLHRRMHRIRSGPQTIVVTVPRKPTHAGIDPDHLLIDLDTEDNVAAVETGR